MTYLLLFTVSFAAVLTVWLLAFPIASAPTHEAQRLLRLVRSSRKDKRPVSTQQRMEELILRASAKAPGRPGQGRHRWSRTPEVRGGGLSFSKLR